MPLDSDKQRDRVAIGDFNHLAIKCIGLGGRGERGDKRQAKRGENRLDWIHVIALSRRFESEWRSKVHSSSARYARA